jgi:hypothetical protein
MLPARDRVGAPSIEVAIARVLEVARRAHANDASAQLSCHLVAPEQREDGLTSFGIFTVVGHGDIDDPEPTIRAARALSAATGAVAAVWVVPELETADGIVVYVERVGVEEAWKATPTPGSTEAGAFELGGVGDGDEFSFTCLPINVLKQTQRYPEGIYVASAREMDDAGRTVMAEGPTA